jgi:hypothetical protein
MFLPRFDYALCLYALRLYFLRANRVLFSLFLLFDETFPRVVKYYDYEKTAYFAVSLKETAVCTGLYCLRAAEREGIYFRT